MAVATGINARGSTFSVPLYGRIRGTGGSAGIFNDPPVTIVDGTGKYVPSQFPSAVYAQAIVNIANAQVLTLSSVGVQLVAAQGAGTCIFVDQLVINNIFKTGAYASGSAIAAYIGGIQGVGTICTATIPANFLTGPTANAVAMAQGAITGSNGALSSVALNGALYLCAGGTDFTTGAGSLVVIVNYFVISGLS